MLSSTTMQTKRILSWFSVLQSTNNIQHAGMGNSFRYLYAKNYQHRTWFDRVIEKIKGVQIFASQVLLHNMQSPSVHWWCWLRYSKDIQPVKCLFQQSQNSALIENSNHSHDYNNSPNKHN